MTLILSAVAPPFAIQVSDRLLTSDAKPFDHEANKTVLLCGSDGVVSMSYTGPAYLMGMPTDNRIAEALTYGIATKHRGTAFTSPAKPLNVGHGLHLIKEHLQKFRRFTEGGGEIVGVGWQWGSKGRHIRPVGFEIRPLDRRHLQVSHVLPRRPDGQLNIFSAGDDPFTSEQFQELGEEIKAGAAKATDLDDLMDASEDVLVNAIRRAAAIKTTIGPNCMSVRLRRDSLFEPSIRFIPQRTPEILRKRNGSAEISFAPWMIGPGFSSPPSRLIGRGQGLKVGDFEIHMDGADPPPGGPLMAWGSQIRPRVAGYMPSEYDTPHPWE